jgi:hypothetical protein
MDEYVYTYLCPKAIQKVLREEDTFPPLNMKVRQSIRWGSAACGVHAAVFVLRVSAAW